MLRAFYPYEYYDSVFDIDWRDLYEKGIRGLIFDIDNTLVPHGKDSTPEVDGLFRELRALGFRTLVLSNNNKERVTRFLRNIDAPYVCDADKPRPEGYEKAVSLLGLPREQLVCVGDQVFTDVLGANRRGLKSILVHYIRKPGEKKIGIRRRLEQVLLWFYFHSRYQHRIGHTD